MLTPATAAAHRNHPLREGEARREAARSAERWIEAHQTRGGGRRRVGDCDRRSRLRIDCIVQANYIVEPGYPRHVCTWRLVMRRVGARHAIRTERRETVCIA